MSLQNLARISYRSLSNPLMMILYRTPFLIGGKRTLPGTTLWPRMECEGNSPRMSTAEWRYWLSPLANTGHRATKGLAISILSSQRMNKGSGNRWPPSFMSARQMIRRKWGAICKLPSAAYLRGVLTNTFGTSINLVRPARPNNMLQSWSIPSDGEQFMEFPPLSADDKETNDSIQWWNKRLAGIGQDVKVVAGAETEIHMNPPPRWFFF